MVVESRSKRPSRPRSFQAEAVRLCQRLRADAGPRRFLFDITPGGGKSVLPVIFANILIGAGLANRICWVTPRITLNEQAEEEFANHNLGFNERNLRIRQSTNDLDPSRTNAGFASTNNAIMMDAARTVAHEFRRYRYILIVDECHHLEVGSPLAKAFAELIDGAAFVIFMTGNPSRSNGARVYGLPYDAKGNIDKDAPGWAYVRYTRREALQDRAKIPIHCWHANGKVKYKDVRNEEHTVERISDDDDPDTIYAALSTEYRDQLLHKGVEHWRWHKERRARRSKLLIVCRKIEDAKSVVNRLKALYDIRAGLATCQDEGKDNSTQAQAAIREFKKTDGSKPLDCLVTVAMAYEGLDCKAITHVIALTHIRAYPWVEQMVDRGTRADPDSPIPVEWQRCYLFVPDDLRMQRCLSRIKADERDPAREWEDEDEDDDVDSGRKPGKTSGKREPIIPLASELTGSRETIDDGDAGAEIGPAESAFLEDVIAQGGLSLTPLELKLAFGLAGATYAVPPDFVPTTLPFRDLTPSEEEKAYRKAIQERAVQIDRDYFGEDYGKTNGIIKKHFRKERKNQTLPELRDVWVFLGRQFPDTTKEQA